MSTAHAAIAVAATDDVGSSPAGVTSAPVTRVEILDLLDATFAAGPANRTTLIGVARTQGARAELIDLLERLPERQYAHQRQLWTDLPDIPVGL